MAEKLCHPWGSNSRPYLSAMISGSTCRACILPASNWSAPWYSGSLVFFVAEVWTRPLKGTSIQTAPAPLRGFQHCQVKTYNLGRNWGNYSNWIILYTLREAKSTFLNIGTRPIFLKWKFHSSYTLTVVRQARIGTRKFGSNRVGDGDGSLEDQTWDFALEKGLFNLGKAKASMKKEVEVLCCRTLTWPDSSVHNFTRFHAY